MKLDYNFLRKEVHKIPCYIRGRVDFVIAFGVNCKLHLNLQGLVELLTFLYGICTYNEVFTRSSVGSKEWQFHLLTGADQSS